MSTASNKRMILMRGLPSCGKTHRAKILAEEAGGVCIEFDQFFETGPDGKFSWHRKRLPEARKYHFQRVRQAADAGVPTIVIDDDHRPGPTAKAVVALGLFAGYDITFAEPDSAWWHAIRPLLSTDSPVSVELAQWAEKLTAMSKSSHRVPLRTFLYRMSTWNSTLSVCDLLAWNEEVAA